MRRSRLLTAIAVASLLPTTAALAGNFEPIPNTKKYRDSAPNEQARSAGATVEARALLRASGSTKVEITTGQLDVTDSATGTIEKVQLRIGGGKSLKTRNYGNPDGGGTFSVSVSGLTRGTPIAIQVHVRSEDSRRVEVLDLATTVRLSPDLEVSSIDVPREVTAGAEVSVLATIRERNGDTGARATCKLYVDGSRVDEAANIWVDAGGTVSCLFSTTFAAGTHRLQATASSVVPSDWDKANNVAIAEIIARPAGPSGDAWSASASQETKFQQHTTTWSNRAPEHTDYSERTDIAERAVFNATIGRMVDLSTLHVTFVESTDGKLIQRLEEGDFVPHGPTPDCRLADNRSTVITVCSSNGKTTVNMSRGAGAATYLSRWWSERYNPSTGQSTWEQHVINDSDPTFGADTRFGTTVQMDVTVRDGGGSWHADPYIIFEPYEKPKEVTRNCRPYNDGLGTTVCTDSRIRITGKRGTDASD